MDWHALDSSYKREYIRVAFHIFVPNANNSIGVSYRSALILNEPFVKSSVASLTTEEIACLETAELIERVELVKFNANLTQAQKIIVINNRYTALVQEVQLEIQNRYIYWGYSTNVD